MLALDVCGVPLLGPWDRCPGVGPSTPRSIAPSSPLLSEFRPAVGTRARRKSLALCFDIDANSFCRNPLVLIFMQTAQGVYPSRQTAFAFNSLQTALHGAVSVPDFDRLAQLHPPHPRSQLRIAERRLENAALLREVRPAAETPLNCSIFSVARRNRVAGKYPVPFWPLLNAKSVPYAAKPPLSPSFHPHSSMSDCSLGASWASSIQQVLLRELPALAPAFRAGAGPGLGTDLGCILSITRHVESMEHSACCTADCFAGFSWQGKLGVRPLQTLAQCKQSIILIAPWDVYRVKEVPMGPFWSQLQDTPII
jgi:hypothetical protein